MSAASSDGPESPAVNKGITWGSWQAIIVVVIVFIAAQYVALQLATVYPVLQGWSSDRTDNWLTNSVHAQFLYVLCAEALTVASIVGFIRWRRGSLRAIGLKRPKLLDDVGLALIGLIIYFVVFLVAVEILTRIFPGLNTAQEQAIGFDGAQGWWQLTLVACSLVILPPIVEEFIFRGFLYSTLRKSLSLISTVIVTSLLFAAPHLLQATDGTTLWIAGIDTFALSLVLCWLREKTGRIYAGIGVHALKNGIAFFVLFIVPQLRVF